MLAASMNYFYKILDLYLVIFDALSNKWREVREPTQTIWPLTNGEWLFQHPSSTRDVYVGHSAVYCKNKNKLHFKLSFYSLKTKLQQ